jgi:hypothetical protein
LVELLVVVAIIGVLTGLVVAGAQKYRESSNRLTRLRVYFVGNSLTFYNNMPAMVQALAREAGETKQLDWQMFASSSFTLQNHWNNGAPLQGIRTGNYDYVILQEQSTGPLDDNADFVIYATKFDVEIKATGAKTILYETWALKSAPLQDTQNQLNRAYTTLGSQLGAKVSPVGQAWRLARMRVPQIVIFNSDGKHPTPAGSYLIACVHYCVLYGSSPIGLPSKLVDVDGTVLVDLPADQARALQRVAYDAVQSTR